MKYSMLYDGGLGDVIYRMFEGNRYASLENLKPGDTCDVHIVSHNPSSPEFWKWHPNKDQLNLIVYPWREVEKNSQIREWNNVPPDCYPEGSTVPPIMYASEDDWKILASIPQFKGPSFDKYVVVAPVAGAGRRTIPNAVFQQICSVILSNGLTPILVGKSYERPGIRSLREEFIYDIPKGVISLVDKLSAPGTARLIQASKAVVCCHSAVCMLNWFLYRKPNLVFYPDDYAANVSEINNRPMNEIKMTVEDMYNFGRFFPETTTVFMSTYRDEILQKVVAS